MSRKIVSVDGRPLEPEALRVGITLVKVGERPKVRLSVGDSAVDAEPGDAMDMASALLAIAYTALFDAALLEWLEAAFPHSPELFESFDAFRAAGPTKH